MKKVKTLLQLKNHPLVDEVWKEGQDNQYDDCDEVFWLSLKEGYIFEYEQSSLITTRGFVYAIVDEFNFQANNIVEDDR
tara:strand:+ start:513 stop:749 length:237 start_codon:yes stop_codon:yes gene_type:complete